MFELPRLPDPDEDVATATAGGVLSALERVREELVALRQTRAAINARIKVRVAHEAALERMARIAKEIMEEVRDGDQRVDAAEDVLDQ